MARAYRVRQEDIKKLGRRVRPDVRALSSLFVLVAVLWAAPQGADPARAQIVQAGSGGQPVLPDNALLTTPVGGLGQTGATALVVPVAGEPFTQALRVTIRTASADTNATQLTMTVPGPVAKGDVLLASFYVRGTAAGGKAPAQMAFLFERSLPPWRSSTNQGVTADRRPGVWKRVAFPFTATEDYAPGVAMASLRFAFGPQTLEVGGLSVVNYHATTTLNALVAREAAENPLGPARVAVNLKAKRQTLLGLGGDFCQPRYGDTTPMDAVGTYVLRHLAVAQARVGLPLNVWAPARGVYQDTGAAHAALLQMQMLARRHIPLIASIWEGPGWLLPGTPESSGRTLAPGEYADCIGAIAQFLVTARDRYGVTVNDLSFNEANYGVNFLFPPAQMAAFIRQAGPRFRALGLKTRFLAGDTTGGMPLPDYVRPLLADPTLAPFLGPIAFHCWDALSAPDAQYARIAALGREFHKPVWCTEAGYDAALWQAPDPWASWENGLQTAQAYAKTLRLTGAATMDYWTYENNYPLVSQDGLHPYPVFLVLQQMQAALPAGGRVVTADSDTLSALATVGPQAGRFSLLLVDVNGAGTVTVSGLPPGRPVRVLLSDASGQGLKMLSPTRTTRTGTLTLAIPPRSVVTVLGSR